MMDARFRFVVDTHALWWYLKSPKRLTAAAIAVIRPAANSTYIIW